MNFKLLILVISVQIVALIFGIILVFVGEKKCATSNCKQIASMINEYVNDEIKPCDDFYTFACGKKLQSNNSDIGLVDITAKLLLEKIADFLDKVEEGSKPAAFYKAKLIYNQCLEKEDPSETKEHMLEFVQKGSIGFPARDGDIWTQQNANFTLIKAIEKLKRQGMMTDAFFSLGFKRSPFDPSKYIMCISVQKPYVIFKPQFLAMCSDECQKALISVYSKILVAASVKPEVAENEAKELLSYDMKIAELTYQRVPLLPHVYKDRIVTVDKFTSTYSFFEWKEYFNIMFGFPATSESLPKDTKIIVEDPDYLSEIKLLLENSTKRQLGNYMVWYNLLQFLYYPELPRDSNYCFNIFMAQTMPEMLTALAVRVRDESNYGMAKKMLKNLGEELENEIKISTWMDEQTKEEALKKMNELEITMGYYDLFLDYDLIDEYFKDTGAEFFETLVGKNFYNSYRTIWHYKSSKESYCFANSFDNKLCKLMIYGDLNLFSPNVLYDPLINGIVVADSILREPLFLGRLPKYMHYSKLGFYLGHELTHTLDSIGAYYDEKGNLKDWWSKETSKSFQEKSQCFDDQVSQFKFFNGDEREHLPGNRSLTENIADNGGFTISLKSYKRNKGFLSDPTLTGVKYSPDQLFFISLAHLYCDAYTQAEYPEAFYGVHAPNPIRVDEILQNSREFSEAFSCEAESDMNPTAKCNLW